MHWSSGGGSLHAVAGCQLTPENNCVTTQWLWVYGKAQQKPAPRFAPLSQRPLSNVSERGSSMASTSLLSLERSYHLSEMHSKNGNCFSPCNQEDPQTMLPAPRSLPSIPTGGQLSLPGVTWQWCRLPKLQTLHSVAYKNLQYSASLRFPINGLGEEFFSCNPLHVFPPFPSFFFSCSSLRDQDSVPSTAPTALFSSKSTLHRPYLPGCGRFLFYL